MDLILQCPYIRFNRLCRRSVVEMMNVDKIQMILKSIFFETKYFSLHLKYSDRG